MLDRAIWVAGADAARLAIEHDSTLTVQTSQTMTSIGATLYERIDGSEAIEAAIEAFYERVLDDDRVSHYFDGMV